MKKIRRFYFILPKIDHSTYTLFWDTGFVIIPVIYWNSNNDSVFCVPSFQKDYSNSSCWRQIRVFCILHILRIHTGLWKWSKRNIFDFHLKKKNPFDIRVPCIKIENSELLIEQYRMSLNREKYDIEFQNDDAIKRN